MIRHYPHSSRHNWHFPVWDTVESTPRKVGNFRPIWSSGSSFESQRAQLSKTPWHARLAIFDQKSQSSQSKPLICLLCIPHLIVAFRVPFSEAPSVNKEKASEWPATQLEFPIRLRAVSSMILHRTCVPNWVRHNRVHTGTFIKALISK